MRWQVELADDRLHVVEGAGIPEVTTAGALVFWNEAPAHEPNALVVMFAPGAWVRVLPLPERR